MTDRFERVEHGLSGPCLALLTRSHTNNPKGFKGMTKKNVTLLVIWSAFGLCTATSVTFNILHSSMITDSVIALVIGAVWPVTAVLAVEVLTRVAFPKGELWQWARFGGVGLVALGAMVISYIHTFHVLKAWGESVVTAAVGPLVIDGLMTLSGAALLALHTRKPPARRRRAAAAPRKPRLAKVAA